MADQKGLDFLKAILGGQDQNTGLPLFTDQDVPVSNVQPEIAKPQGMPYAGDLDSFLKDRMAKKQIPQANIKPVPTVPSAVDGSAPMMPEDFADNSVGSPDPVAQATALKQAPVSRVKEAFQATQSPEQKMVAQKLADSQNPLVDNQMQAALAQAKEQADTNQRRKALFEMMSGIGSLGGSKMSAESESLDNAIKMQNAPVDQINQERDAYKKFLSNKEEMEKADPNSAVSKTMRDALSGMGVKIPDNASYATMENLAPQLMKNKEFQMRLQEMQLKREELAQNKEAQKSLKAEQQIAKTRDSVLKSERYKNLAASTEAIQGARSNLELARKGYSQGYSALGANLAKLAGEKGMLSEADVNRYLVAKGVPGKLESGKLELTGKPTKQQIDALEQIVNSLESDVRKKGVQFAEDELSGYSQGLNVTPEQIESVLPELKRLKSGASSSSQPKTNKPKTIIQNGHTYTLNESTGEYE